MAKGWTVVSMKNDWKVIYRGRPSVVRCHGRPVTPGRDRMSRARLTRPWRIVEYRRLGRTELRVSAVGVGTCQLRLVPEKQAIDTLLKSFALGVNIVHTAPDYGNAEDIVARAVNETRRQGVRRLAGLRRARQQRRACLALRAALRDHVRAARHGPAGSLRHRLYRRSRGAP